MHNWERCIQELASIPYWFPELWSEGSGVSIGYTKPSVPATPTREIVNQEQQLIPWRDHRDRCTTKDLKDASHLPLTLEFGLCRRQTVGSYKRNYVATPIVSALPAGISPLEEVNTFLTLDVQLWQMAFPASVFIKTSGCNLLLSGNSSNTPLQLHPRAVLTLPT